MELAERLADGFLHRESIQGGSLAIPVCDDRVEIFDDDRLADLLEDLFELPCTNFGLEARFL